MEENRYCPICNYKIPESEEYYCPNCIFDLDRRNDSQYLIERRNRYRSEVLLEREEPLSNTDGYDEFGYQQAEEKEGNRNQVSTEDTGAFFIVLELLMFFIGFFISDD
jgi:hypothetical protein